MGMYRELNGLASISASTPVTTITQRCSAISAMLANQVTLTRAPQDAHEMLLAGPRKSFLELERHCLPQAGHCSACIVVPNA